MKCVFKLSYGPCGSPAYYIINGSSYCEGHVKYVRK